MAQHNITKAKAIHEQLQAQRDARVSAMKQGTVGIQLQDFIDKGYKRPNTKVR